MPCAWTTRSAPAARWWSDLDGLLVGGGLTPAYHRVLLPHAVAIRVAVADGLPYAGFSAGAMIAPQRALLGGWRLGSTAVTHEDNAEDLDQVTVVDGLGLVSSTVEVHTSQWGTLSRLVAAVAAERPPRGSRSTRTQWSSWTRPLTVRRQADGASVRCSAPGRPGS